MCVRACVRACVLRADTLVRVSARARARACEEMRGGGFLLFSSFFVNFVPKAARARLALDMSRSMEKMEWISEREVKFCAFPRDRRGAFGALGGDGRRLVSLSRNCCAQL